MSCSIVIVDSNNSADRRQWANTLLQLKQRQWWGWKSNKPKTNKKLSRGETTRMTDMMEAMTKIWHWTQETRAFLYRGSKWQTKSRFGNLLVGSRCAGRAENNTENSQGTDRDEIQIYQFHHSMSCICNSFEGNCRNWIICESLHPVLATLCIEVSDVYLILYLSLYLFHGVNQLTT